jgi:multidrug efflux system membrane fusion protein
MNNISTRNDDTSRRASSRPTTAWLRRPWLWLLPLCLIGVAGYFFLSEPGRAQQRGGRSGMNRPVGPMPVVAMPAKTEDINVYLDGLGTVTPLNTVTVKSRVDGQLMRVLFHEGQVIKAGDLLAEIDTRPYQVQLTQAEGQMAKDQALLKNAQLDLERYKTLFAQDSIAKQQLDTQASLVRQYEGAIKADQGQIDNAKLQLVYCRVTAPVGGRLGLRQVDPGNIVHASDANGLVVITQLQPITVLFTIPEDSVRGVMKKLQAGEKLPVDAFDRSGKTKLASGFLLTADNQIDPATGTVKLKAQFANEDYGLFPNQFVNARMLVDVQRSATVIPSAGIQRGTQGTFAYVVKPDNTVGVRPIKLGPTEGDRAAIESGLAPGDAVVVDGGDKLRDGAQVAVISRDAAAPTPGATAQDGNDAKRAKGRHRRGDGAAAAAPAASPAPQ